MVFMFHAYNEMCYGKIMYTTYILIKTNDLSYMSVYRDVKNCICRAIKFHGRHEHMLINLYQPPAY